MCYSNADYSILPFTYLWFAIVCNFTMTKFQTLLKSITIYQNFTLNHFAVIQAYIPYNFC